MSDVVYKTRCICFYLCYELMRKYTRQLKYTRSHPTRAPLAHYKTMTQIAHAAPRERNTGLRTDTRHEHDPHDMCDGSRRWRRPGRGTPKDGTPKSTAGPERAAAAQYRDRRARTTLLVRWSRVRHMDLALVSRPARAGPFSCTALPPHTISLYATCWRTPRPHQIPTARAARVVCRPARLGAFTSYGPAC